MHPAMPTLPYLRRFAALGALALGSAPLAAQEGPPPLPQLETAAEQSAREEMLELFARVETRMAEIDDLLYGASAGEVALEGVEDAGIDDLLRHTIQRGEEALSDIDRILEIARQQSSSSSSSNSGEPQGEGQGQPSGGQQPQSQGGAKEATPEKPEAGGQEKQPGGQPTGGDPESQPQGGQVPRDPGAAPERDPENRPGGTPPPADTERLSVREDAERWGDLPVHVREKFRSEGGGDLPPHYREWIESYYRRLNRASDSAR